MNKKLLGLTLFSSLVVLSGCSSITQVFKKGTVPVPIVRELKTNGETDSLKQGDIHYSGEVSEMFTKEDKEDLYSIVLKDVKFIPRKEEENPNGSISNEVEILMKNVVIMDKDNKKVEKLNKGDKIEFITVKDTTTTRSIPPQISNDSIVIIYLK